MNCAVHHEAPAVAFCRTCGKPMCVNCRREVRGVIYCEECIATRLGDAAAAQPQPTAYQQVMEQGLGMRVPPLDQGPNPALAAMLGFIPGVGAMYNGQFAKAMIHVVVFVSLIFATDRIGVFGVFIPFWIFYMVFEAYQTAKARRAGSAAPDPLGIDRMFGTQTPPPMGTAVGFAPSANQGQGTQPPPGMVYAPQPEEFRHGPIGAIVLVALGALFLLDTFHVFDARWFARCWPVILIVMGVWIWVRRQPPSQ